MEEQEYWSSSNTLPAGRPLPIQGFLLLAFVLKKSIVEGIYTLGYY